MNDSNASNRKRKFTPKLQEEKDTQLGIEAAAYARKAKDVWISQHRPLQQVVLTEGQSGGKDEEDSDSDSGSGSGSGSDSDSGSGSDPENEEDEVDMQ